MYQLIYEDEFIKVLIPNGYWGPPTEFHIKMRDIDGNQYLVRGHIDVEISKSFLAMIKRRNNE